MKKILNLWLMAALTVGLGLSVTSCKDDDDDNTKSEEQKEQQAQEQQTKFWSVVGQLVSTDDYTEDYADKTFEPVIGTPESEGSLTRLVATNDMQTAAQRFADLVGASNIDENTPSYTYSDPEVGTLTYTRGGTADEWATVDVSIKQVPKLRKIIYRQGGEGTNASFTGKAWYRFGDVVSRQVDGQTEYWICVRPAFGPESKGDSHWACLNSLPLKNQKHYTASDNAQYYLPTGVGTSKEHMQNLAEMLYAICYPEQWYNNASNYHTDGKLWGFSGLPIFTDFSKAKLQYHNQYFWQRVQDAWQGNEIADKALNLDLGALADVINRDGINLLYNGYSWWFLSSWDCKLWQASYTNGSTNAEKNLHHAAYSEPEKNMKGVKFDCRSMGENSDNYRQFFGDGKYRWVFRTATGKQLNGGTQPDPTARLQGGCTDVYRYYEKYPEEWYKGTTPEITDGSLKNDPDDWDTAAYSGFGHYKVGDVYKDEQGNRWICVGQSGVQDEESPYAEFVSFDGLTASADKRCIANLPNRDQALRGAFRLNMIFAQSSDHSGDALADWAGKEADYGNIVMNCRDAADVDPSMLFQRISAQNNDPRQDTHAASIAYNDGTGRQRLLRWVMNNQNNGNELMWYLADTYVDKPNGDEQKYGEAAYGTTPIYLDDMRSTDIIAAVATDTYAKQGLSKNDAKNNNGPTAARNYRTAADPDANDATNYLYSRTKWDNRTFKTDMWNEPIVMFRYTRLYDRGDNEYANRTADGHYLTLVKEHVWYRTSSKYNDDEERDEDAQENIESFANSTLWVQAQNINAADAWHLNGKVYTFPKWNTIGN